MKASPETPVHISGEERFIDVSALKDSTLDHRSAAWWGNTLLLLIETTMFVLLVASYFYLRQNFTQWPPVQPNGNTPNFRPVPALGIPTINTIIILWSCLPMYLAVVSAERHKEGATRFWMTTVVVVAIATIVLRFYDFRALYFKWDENAYAAVVWSLVGLHLGHLFTALGEGLMMTAWAYLKPLDDKHVRDIRLLAIYWYWIVAVWAIVYGIVYVAPHYW